MSVWSWLVGQPEVLAALLGTVFGAVLGFAGTAALTWWQDRKSRAVAKMHVATRVRSWASQVYVLVCEVATFDDSDGAGGRRHTRLPALRLEDELDQVAALGNTTAQQVFDFIAKKDTANTLIEGVIEYVDLEEGTNTFRDEGAKLYLEAVTIYQALAASLGWAAAFTQDDLERMQKERTRAEWRAAKYDAQNAKKLDEPATSA